MNDPLPSPQAPDAPMPPRIAGYRLLRPLGEGGMARVWLAEQVSLGREVAIKVIAREALADEAARQRFEREARTIARLAHPSIVAIHEVGRTEDGLIYYVMPYLGRGDLSQRRLGGDPARLLEVMRALLQALGHAHAQGVVHRDVKAENILFDASDRPLLADFGIALERRDLSRISASRRITTAGLAVGSGAAMAPEQARGDEVDGRADLYSAGVLLYELLTGQAPFQGDDPLALALKHAQAPIPRLPAEQRAWQPIVDRSLAKSPEARYPDAAAMLADIERVAARRPADAAGGWRPSRRRLRLAAAVLAVLAVLAGGLLLVPGSPPRTGPGMPSGTDAALQIDPGAPPEDSVDARLLAFEEQLARDRLTRQTGDNATESLYAAWQLAPEDPRVPDALERLLGRLSVHMRGYVERDEDEEVRGAFARARSLAVDTGQGGSEGWRRFKLALTQAIETRIETAVDAYDRVAGERAASLLQELGLMTPDVQDIAALVERIPVPGAPIRDADGPELSFVLPGRPALAVMRHAVSRGDYDRFARETGREAANCPDSGGLRVFNRRSWQRPGFEQSDLHPVVCVSWHDAEAYARWLSARTGHRYRLPSLAEWHRLSRLAQSAPAASGGTLPAGEAGRDALGLYDLGGNVSEWLADGNGGHRYAGGRSWRDSADVAFGWTGAQEAGRGFDDVGFRLVREMASPDRERPIVAAQ